MKNKLWAGQEKVNIHSDLHAHSQRINISANCPLLTGQPPPYLGFPGWVTIGEHLSPHTESRDQVLIASYNIADLSA